jgi:hypothetical protein
MRMRTPWVAAGTDIILYRDYVPVKQSHFVHLKKLRLELNVRLILKPIQQRHRRP